MILLIVMVLVGSGTCHKMFCNKAFPGTEINRLCFVKLHSKRIKEVNRARDKSVLQIAMGAFVSFFFSGFILGKVPFPLSPSFRIMLQVRLFSLSALHE